MHAFLEIHDVTKKFRQGNTHVDVLRGVSAQFLAGMTYAITGVSGSGKSTLLHVLSGLERPDYGTVVYNGRLLYDFTALEREHFLNKAVGLVFQSPFLIHELTVLENILLKNYITGAYQENEAVGLLERAGLTDKIHALPTTLSGGQKQRVALVRALLGKPQFLIADEPTASLDRATADVIIDLLLQYQAEWNMGLIIASHDRIIAEAMNHEWHLQDGVLQHIRG